MISDIEILNKRLQKLHYLLAKIFGSKIVWTAHLGLRSSMVCTLNIISVYQQASFTLRAAATEATYGQGRILSSFFYTEVSCVWFSPTAGTELSSRLWQLDV